MHADADEPDRCVIQPPDEEDEPAAALQLQLVPVPFGCARRDPRDDGGQVPFLDASDLDRAHGADASGGREAKPTGVPAVQLHHRSAAPSRPALSLHEFVGSLASVGQGESEDTSDITTCPSAPTRSSAAKAISPSPAPTSSSVSPARFPHGRAPARVGTRCSSAFLCCWNHRRRVCAAATPPTCRVSVNRHTRTVPRTLTVPRRREYVAIEVGERPPNSTEFFGWPDALPEHEAGRAARAHVPPRRWSGCPGRVEEVASLALPDVQRMSVRARSRYRPSG